MSPSLVRLDSSLGLRCCWEGIVHDSGSMVERMERGGWVIRGWVGARPGARFGARLGESDQRSVSHV